MNLDELTPETRARVDSLQEWIKNQNIKDIKFDRNGKIWDDASYEQRAKDICDLLECICDGKFKPLPPIGDSVKLKSAQQEIFDVYMKERGQNANT